jgi:DNA-binding MarR family transcriptional regulator
VKGGYMTENYRNEALRNDKLGWMAYRLIEGAKGLRGVFGSDMPFQQIMILLYLWLHSSSDPTNNSYKINQRQLSDNLGIMLAATSRHCRSLSSYYVKDPDDSTKEIQKGQNLIVAERNRVRNNEINYRLTAETEAIITKYLSTCAGVKRLGD